MERQKQTPVGQGVITAQADAGNKRHFSITKPQVLHSERKQAIRTGAGKANYPCGFRSPSIRAPTATGPQGSAGTRVPRACPRVLLTSP